MSEESIATSSLKTRVVAYSITAGATLASMPVARGSIVYSGPLNLTVGAGVDQVISLTGNGNEFRFFYSLEELAPPSPTPNANYEWVERIGANVFDVDRFDAGQTIGSSLNSAFDLQVAQTSRQAHLFFRDNQTGEAGDVFSDQDTQPDAQQRVAKRGYLPVRLDDGVASNYHYGWVDYMPSNDGANATIFGYAYETQVGAAIAAGAVPEPAESAFALGVLALGAAGLHRLRRQRALALEAARTAQTQS
jgi:hypothetical protein